MKWSMMLLFGSIVVFSFQMDINGPVYYQYIKTKR